MSTRPETVHLRQDSVVVTSRRLVIDERAFRLDHVREARVVTHHPSHLIALSVLLFDVLLLGFSVLHPEAAPFFTQNWFFLTGPAYIISIISIYAIYTLIGSRPFYLLAIQRRDGSTYPVFSHPSREAIQSVYDALQGVLRTREPDSETQYPSIPGYQTSRFHKGSPEPLFSGK